MLLDPVRKKSQSMVIGNRRTRQYALARDQQAVLLLVAVEPEAAHAGEDVVLEKAHGADVLLADDGERLGLRSELRPWKYYETGNGSSQPAPG